MNILPATLVEATAGRDKGKFFAVIDIVNEEYVLICDGRRRKVSSLKKKKIKHIRSLDYSLKEIKEKLETGNKISNSDVKKSIRKALIELGILFRL